MGICNIIFAACLPFTYTLVAGGKTIRVKLKPVPTRLAFACIYLTSPDAELTPAQGDFVSELIRSTVLSVVIDGDEIPPSRLSPTIQNALVNFIMNLNGLTPESAGLLQEELRKLKENVKAQMKHQPPPNPYEPWMGLANAAYAALSQGGNFAADNLLDEPFIAILLANTIAEAEREYLEEEQRKARMGRGEVVTTEQEIPLPPKGKVDISAEMRKIFEAITGVPLPPKP